MLVNEFEPIERHGERIYLAGIDDAHFYRMDNIEKALGRNSGLMHSPCSSHIRPRFTNKPPAPALIFC